MLETLNSGETENYQTNSRKITPPYTPPNLNFPQENGEDPNAILEQLDDEQLDDDQNGPKLTNEQKQEMVTRCKQKINAVELYLSTLKSSRTSQQNKEKAINNLKTICDSNAKIRIRINREYPDLSLDEFFDAIQSNIINLNDYTISSITFNEGEFIKHEIPKPGGTQVYYTRNIKTIRFIKKDNNEDNNNVRVQGISDIEN